MSANFQRAGMLLVLCILAGCSPTPKMHQLTPSGLQPTTGPQDSLAAKVRQQYPSDRYLIGIGQADSEKAATELARAEPRLRTLPPRERQTVETLTTQIVNKLLHQPTVRLKQAAAAPQPTAHAQVLTDLFALGEEI